MNTTTEKKRFTTRDVMVIAAMMVPNICSIWSGWCSDTSVSVPVPFTALPVFKNFSVQPLSCCC